MSGKFERSVSWISLLILSIGLPTAYAWKSIGSEAGFVVFLAVLSVATLGFLWIGHLRLRDLEALVRKSDLPKSIEELQRHSHLQDRQIENLENGLFQIRGPQNNQQAPPPSEEPEERPPDPNAPTAWDRINSE